MFKYAFLFFMFCSSMFSYVVNLFSYILPIMFLMFLSATICRPKISPPKVICKVQSMPYKSLPLGAFWTIFGRNFPTGVPELLYPYQPANPLVESIFKAFFLNFELALGDRSYDLPKSFSACSDCALTFVLILNPNPYCPGR